MSCHRLSTAPVVRPAESLLKSSDLEDANLTALLAMSHNEKEEQRRKQRMEETLHSLKSRLEACEGTLKVETLIAKEMIVKFGKMERSLCIAVSLLGLMALVAFYGKKDPIMLVTSALACVMSFWFYRTSADKKKIAFEAVHALDLVTARFDGLHSGVARCEQVLQQDLESDVDWQRQEDEDRKRWEEERTRMEQLQLERVRTSFQTLHPKLSETQRKKQQERAAAEATASKANRRAYLKKQKSSGGSRSFRNLFNSFKQQEPVPKDQDDVAMTGLSVLKAEPPFPTNTAKTWMDYVNLALPLERLAKMTDEERHFSKSVRTKTQGRWDQIPLDLKLMALRAWETKKDRLEFTAEQVEYIVDWRSKCQADAMLSTASDSIEEKFFGAWKTRFGREDTYGHPIVYDRVEDFDLDFLYSLSDEQVLTCHTKQMEVLRRRKIDIGVDRGQRVCKHVYILDLKGLSLNKHFTNRMKNLLVSIFKLEGTAYPDSLWSLWLINTPMVFKLIWGALSPGIDPASKAKIRMRGDAKDYLPEMEKCGIPASAVPKDLGGEYQSTTYWEALKEIIEEDTSGNKTVLNATF